MTLVPLDVTHQHRIDDRHRALLAAGEHPLTDVVAQALDFYLGFYETVFGERAAALHDPLAAGIAVGTVVVTESQDVRIDVSCDRKTYGRTRVIGGEEGSPCRVVLDAAPFADRLIDAITTTFGSCLVPG